MRRVGARLVGMAPERCPICRAVALYVGLERLECPTPECANFGGTRARPVRGEQLWLDLPARPHRNEARVEP